LSFEWDGSGRGLRRDRIVDGDADASIFAFGLGGGDSAGLSFVRQAGFELRGYDTPHGCLIDVRALF
jgi:hypothetical protein